MPNRNEMLGRFPSRTIIIICLLIAIGSLFLRNIVYIGHSRVSGTQVGKEQQAGSAPIILAYNERPPYYITSNDHVLSGLIGEIALSAFRRSGLPYTLQKMPPKRQMNNVENNHERLCALGWFKTPKREEFASFSLPLYQDLPTVVVTRADITFSPPALTLAELFKRTDLNLLAQSGYSYGPYVDEALRQHNPASVTTTGNATEMLEMIDSGKADYFFAATEEANEAITANRNPNHFHLILPRDMPLGNHRYFMCSKQVTPEEIGQLNAAITAENNAKGRVLPNQ